MCAFGLLRQLREIWRRPSCAGQAVLRQGHGMPAASAVEQTCRLHCAQWARQGVQEVMSAVCLASLNVRAHCAKGERLTMQHHQQDMGCSRPPRGGCRSTSYPTLLGHVPRLADTTACSVHLKVFANFMLMCTVH